VAGSIRPRPNKGSDAWELRVFLGRDGSGRVRHKSRLFHGTKRGAEHELARLSLSRTRFRKWFRSSGATVGTVDFVQRRHHGLAGQRLARSEPAYRSTVTRACGVSISNAASGDSTSPRLGPTTSSALPQAQEGSCGRETVRYVRSVLHRACRLARKWSGNTLPNP